VDHPDAHRDAALKARQASVGEVADAPRRPSTAVKLGYGAGDLGLALSYGTLNVFLIYYLVEVAGVRPALAGLVLLSSRILDAGTDPLMGMLTDRTRSRWGRRRPYLLFGAVPFGATFAFIWAVPALGPTVGFLAACGIVYLHMIVFTSVAIPYQSLTPELADDYHGRTSLTSYRMAFVVVATLVAFAAPVGLASAFNGWRGFEEGHRFGWSVMGGVLGAIMTVALGVAGSSVRERPREPENVPLRHMWSQYRSAARAHGFRHVFLNFMAVSVVMGTVSGILPFYMGASARLAPGLQSAMLGLTFGTAMLALPIWTSSATRWGKKAAFLAGILVYGAGLVALALLPGTGAVETPMVLACLTVGVGTGAVLLFPWAMLPDVLEFDELATASRREGVFYSFFTFGQKAAYAVGAFFVGQGLDLFGYVEGASVQPARAIVGIHVLLGGVPLALLILSLLPLLRFPITRESHRRVREELALRRARAL
jgi:glycoside/pentoside/hexuronide:cation symporter, GPH family